MDHEAVARAMVKVSEAKTLTEILEAKKEFLEAAQKRVKEIGEIKLNID